MDEKQTVDIREQVGHYVELAERLEALARQLAPWGPGRRGAVIDLLEAAQFIRDSIAAVVP